VSRYFFVRTQPTISNKIDYFSLIAKLAKEGNAVSILLLHNEIAPAIKSAEASSFDDLLNSPIQIYVDRFSLRQRAINATELKPKIKLAELDIIISARLNGDEIIWN